MNDPEFPLFKICFDRAGSFGHIYLKVNMSLILKECLQKLDSGSFSLCMTGLLKYSSYTV